MDTLPTGASPHSHRRFAVARALADSSPLALGAEIAVTGSVALGLADAHSGVELNLWVPGGAMPAVTPRLAWLEAAGASDFAVEPTSSAENCAFRFPTSRPGAAVAVPVTLARWESCAWSSGPRRTRGEAPYSARGGRRASAD